MTKSTKPKKKALVKKQKTAVANKLKDSKKFYFGGVKQVQLGSMIAYASLLVVSDGVDGAD